ncbi:signal peptide peptidase SppA [Luteimonas viscosa]|uniref:Signal peptide peptidase SppA n=1 Tax=Luteimonas viscosa TaxID=1132694 RepID=A0A5D4XQD2_9GAMM|nr:signal peptide peptidase SppA [Luteimonas viscosa]TYT25991.1 signal peptide peptidase SppA [Luteimonas viscosa]
MSQTPQRGPLLRAIVGVWDGMNFVRRLVFNLLFFFLLLLVLVVLAGGRGGVAPLEARTTLVIAPEALLVEQYTSDPVSRSFQASFGQGPAEVQLRDVLQVLESAKDDANVERVLLRVDRMGFSGFAAIREIGAAIQALRESGKQVVAFGERFTQGQYLLAAQADEVYLDPQGEILLLGLSGYRQFYREGLEDKLGIDMHLFKVGEYKSAAEPFIRDDASPEAKQADLFWRNDVWQRYLADIARLRKTTPQALAAGIDALPEGVAAVEGDAARYAMTQKLVDGLKTQEEVEVLLAERGAADEDAEGGFRQVGFFDYLRHADGPSRAADPRPQVAVVVAEGNILEGRQPPGTIGGESTAALLREARDDDDVKAVVLRVNSGGGSAFASEVIRREVLGLKKADKPVVVSFGDVAASGGYWISMDADRIYADPSTITGSIGIFGLIPTFPRALEKIGVHTDGVATTRMADAFDLSRPLSPEAGQLIQSLIDKGYRDFITRVAQGRGRTPEQIDEVARGRVWTGDQAKARGLVDEFGGLRAAIADAAERARLGKADAWRVRYVERAATPFERWFAGFVEGRLARAWLQDSDLARSLLARAAPQAERDLRMLEQVLKADAAPVKTLAHCFCGL